MIEAAFYSLRKGDRVLLRLCGRRGMSLLGTVYFAGLSYEAFCVGIHWDNQESYQRSSWLHKKDCRRLQCVRS